MDRKRTWQIGLAFALPLIIGALIYFSTNETIEISTGGATQAIPLWAGAAALICAFGLLFGGEMDRAREVVRLNRAIAMERIVVSSPTRDAQANALGTHVQAEVGLIERRLTLDFKLAGIANVVFHEMKDGREVNVNSRRRIPFVHVLAPEGAATVGALCKVIKAAYPEFRPHIVDNDGIDLHGNNKIGKLPSMKL